MESQQSIITDRPLLTVNAHVFHVNPDTNKSWVPVSASAVPVSFCYDANDNTYRILSLNGKKVILNSRMTGEMNFTKTSQKFGQWMDSTANIVYGLGFSSESDLDDFVDQFDDLKEVMLMDKLNSETLDPSPINEIFTTRTPNLEKDVIVANMTFQAEPICQLRQENEKLKMALQQSIRNASMIELEIDKLKNSNAYLTSRLEECTQTMEEWKTQMDFFAEENQRLKTELLNAENVGKQQMSKELIDEIEVLREQIENCTKDLEEKNEEIRVLNETLTEYSAAKESAARLESAFQRLKSEHESFLEKNSAETKVLEDLHSQVHSKLAEIQEIQDRVMNL